MKRADRSTIPLVACRTGSALLPSRSLVFSVAAMALLTPGVMAQPGVSPGQIRAIDVERATITVRNSYTRIDQEFVVDESTTIIDAKGHPLARGVRNESFQVGARVRVMVRPKEGKRVLVGLMFLGDQPGQLPALPVDMTGAKPLAEMAPGESGHPPGG